MNAEKILTHELQPQQGELVQFPNHRDLKTPCSCQVCISYVGKTHIRTILNNLFSKKGAANER